MPAKAAKKKKAKAPLASAPESASLAQLNATQTASSPRWTD